MEVLLRELRDGPDGIAEYHDTEVSSAKLTIGSAADQRIQLLGRAIAAEHAVIERAGGQFKLTCLGVHRIAVNGAQVSSAELTVGDTLELGGHQLRLAAAPAGFDLALELRPNPAIDSSEFESAFRTDLQQTWLRKRSTAWLAVVIVVVVFAIVPFVILQLQGPDTTAPRWLPSDALWSSGPLHAAHEQATGGQCGSCHQKLFERVQDSACLSCHTGIRDHVTEAHLAMTTLGDPPRCATCHREHNDPSSYLVDNGDALCIDCHRKPEHGFGELAVAPVGGFSPTHHPPFAARLLMPTMEDHGTGPKFNWSETVVPLDGAREQSNLKFSHAQHLDPDRVLRTSDSQALGCADCHRLEPDGQLFAPISMANQCASCHELTFDPDALDRQLPHGKPNEVILTLQDYFTRKYSDPNAGRTERVRRRLPGDEEEEKCSGSPFDCAMRSAKKEIETQFTRRGCIGCHIVNDTQNEVLLERFQVHPIRLARDYFPAGRFDHRSHQIQGKLTGDEACASCHKAKTSEDSSELMLPALDTCTECHGDSPSRERVVVQCVSCHAYHPHGQPVTPVSERALKETE